MFSSTLISSVALALSLSTAVLALSGPDAAGRLAANHRFVKRSANQRERRRGYSGGHGGPHHGKKGGYQKSSASKAASSSAAKTTTSAKAYTTSAAVEVNAAYAEATTTSSSKAATSTGSSSSSTSYTGTATWYTQDGTTGACGDKVSDSDYVVALDSDLYGDMDAVSEYCGKTVKITNTANSKTVTATVNDACPVSPSTLPRHMRGPC